MDIANLKPWYWAVILFSKSVKNILNVLILYVLVVKKNNLSSKLSSQEIHEINEITSPRLLQYGVHTLPAD